MSLSQGGADAGVRDGEEALAGEQRPVVKKLRVGEDEGDGKGEEQQRKRYVPTLQDGPPSTPRS